MIRIRPAVVADASEIARLATELGYPASVDEMTSRLTHLLSSESCYVAVAEAPAGLLGWVAAEKRIVLEAGDRAELTGLIVDPASRRSGIGRALVAAAEQWAVGNGFHTINVRSNVARTESHPFYVRLGYQRTKTQHAYARRLVD
jgi:GNAT superfamily N-acetyltransferase